MGEGHYDLQGNSAWVNSIDEVLVDGEVILLELHQHIVSFKITTRWVDFQPQYSDNCTEYRDAVAIIYYTDRRVIWRRVIWGNPSKEFYFIPYELVERITITPVDNLFLLSGLKNLISGKFDIRISAAYSNCVTITCKNHHETDSVLAIFRETLPKIRVEKKWSV